MTASVTRDSAFRTRQPEDSLAKIPRASPVTDLAGDGTRGICPLLAHLTPSNRSFRARARHLMERINERAEWLSGRCRCGGVMREEECFLFQPGEQVGTLGFHQAVGVLAELLLRVLGDDLPIVFVLLDEVLLCFP